MLRGEPVPWQLSLGLKIMQVLQFWIILTVGVSLVKAFIFDMDVKLDSALQKGGALSRNTGSYLFDSFRTEVLTPAFASVLRELKNNHKSDIIVEGTLFILLFGLGIWILVLWFRVKNAAKVANKDRAGTP
jgi:type IV secretory pathway TrbD component